MKHLNIKKAWLIPAVIILLSACKKDFLEQKKLSAVDEAAVFSDSAQSRGIINSLYSNIGMSFNPRRFSETPLDAATDDSEPNLYKNDVTNYISYKLSSGGINSSNVPKEPWLTAYKSIRTSNIFLRNKDKIPVTAATRDLWTGQARFLRAWYYFILLKHYGGIPLIGDKVFEDGETIDVPRSSFEDCVNYIVTELDAAAPLLPVSYPAGDQEERRASRGSVLGTKARLLLYAASPLFNSGPRSGDSEHLLSFATADNERWKKAADAARAVINLNSYDLYKETANPFYQLFIDVRLPHIENVFMYWQPQTTANNFYIENSANPESRGSRNSYVGVRYFPTQELVDAFPMKNGLPITDPASGYTGTGPDMYKNRDPRLTATVHYNGALRLYGSFGDQPVNTYTGVVPTTPSTPPTTSALQDGIYRPTGTVSGYFRYKSLFNDAVGSGSELYRGWVLMRYAEVLLNAAEATNEYSGATAEVYDWLKAIRQRAGITAGTNGLYGLKANMSKEEMREAIRNERRVELAFEEHRFWDVRRWKIAPQTENKETHGMEITRSATGSLSFREIVLRKHVFTDAMYFFPIPQSEIVKSPALKQNPGY